MGEHEGTDGAEETTSSTSAATPAAQPVRLSFAPKTRVCAERVFLCSCDGTVAGTVRLHEGDRDNELLLVIDSFVGEQISRLSTSDAGRVVQFLRHGDIQNLYRMDEEYAPFYCPKCDAVYCGDCWRQWPVFADDYPGWFEEMRGVCPAGHQRRLTD